jgi:hypothetical protein
LTISENVGARETYAPFKLRLGLKALRNYIVDLKKLNCNKKMMPE